MDFRPELLDFVACPQCKGDLRYTREEVLVCLPCRLCFPVENGVPVLDVSKAIPLTQSGSPFASKKSALFIIETEKKDENHFHLELGSCRAIGRRVTDESLTRITTISGTIPLDDHAQKLITNYLDRLHQKKNRDKLVADDSGPTSVKGFRRLSDIVLNDSGASRLHAMVFMNDDGVGIVDLVSKNGTYVNNREVETAVLKDEDVISIGDARIKVQLK